MRLRRDEELSTDQIIWERLRFHFRANCSPIFWWNGFDDLVDFIGNPDSEVYPTVNASIPSTSTNHQKCTRSSSAEHGGAAGRKMDSERQFEARIIIRDSRLSDV